MRNIVGKSTFAVTNSSAFNGTAAVAVTTHNGFYLFRAPMQTVESKRTKLKIVVIHFEVAALNEMAEKPRTL